ncbi:MAG: YceI family protein [Acidimicrobiia bacterium]|nr:YceI family protein [Acidimicrobiia bacterium]
MNRRNILIAGVAGIVVLAAAVWFFFIRSDAPPPASLEEAVAAVTDDTEAPEGDTTDTTAPPATTETTTASVGLDGTWMADQANTFAGYRIGEELASIGTTTAVGRTSNVEATLTFSEAAVTELSVTVDMTTLESDRSRRDGALRTRGLETETFPTAMFVLTEPIDLGAVPEEGESFAATAVGDLTLHGVTNSITMPVEGSLVGGTVVVVGATDVTLTDYDIEAPTGFSVLTIEEVGTIEVQLAFVPG